MTRTPRSNCSLRLTELVMSSTRALQMDALLLQMNPQRDDLIHREQKLAEPRRIGLTRDLVDAIMRITQIRTRSWGLGEKLQCPPGRLSPLSTEPARKTEIRITRKAKQGRQVVGADEDVGLEPSDVVEVALRQWGG